MDEVSGDLQPPFDPAEWDASGLWMSFGADTEGNELVLDWDAWSELQGGDGTEIGLTAQIGTIDDLVHGP